MELAKEVLQILIFTIITGCGVVIVRKILDFINGKIDQLQANTKLAEYEKLNKIIDQIQDSIYTVVDATNQVFVSSLKESNSFDKEAAKAAKQAATETAKAMLTEEAIEAITKTKGDIDVFLDTTIESAVNQLKNNK